MLPCRRDTAFAVRRTKVLYFIQHSPPQKYGVAGEGVHWLQGLKKMQPALLVTAYPAKMARKRKLEAEKAATKKALDKERSLHESTLVQHLSGGDN